jgi:hypothetical protein
MVAARIIITRQEREREREKNDWMARQILNTRYYIPLTARETILSMMLLLLFFKWEKENRIGQNTFTRRIE